MTQSTAVATPEKVHPIAQLLATADAQKYIQPFLPEGADPARVIASVMLAIKMDKSGLLGKCTPESLVLGVARIQQWGLELGVTAHLLPFGKEATPCADYKGLAELMVSSGAVRHIEAGVVREGDTFSYEKGTNAFLRHVPVARAKAGEITHAYVILNLPYNRVAFEVMDAADIDAIRKHYSKQWKSGPLTAWYAKKTVVRQAAKLIPKNPRLAQALATMQAISREEGEEIDPTPGAPAVSTITVEEKDDTPTVDLSELEAADDGRLL